MATVVYKRILQQRSLPGRNLNFSDSGCVTGHPSVTTWTTTRNRPISSGKISTDNVWSAARLQGKSVGEKTSLRKCIRPLVWRSALRARMSCARVSPYKSVGCSFETIFGIRLRTRRCDCSFVLAAPYRPRWVKIARRRSSAGKWERASASKPQASFPHYFIRQSRSLPAGSLAHSTAQPMRSARVC
jgi:hypothetical protein